MARYVTKIRTPWSITESFDYMADLRNFARWDPGVRHVTQTAGDAGGATSVFDVTVVGVPKDLTLTYRTVEYDAPHRLRVVARSRVFISEDRIAVTPDGDGSIVEYDAQPTSRCAPSSTESPTAPPRDSVSRSREQKSDPISRMTSARPARSRQFRRRSAGQGGGARGADRPRRRGGSVGIGSLGAPGQTALDQRVATSA